LLYVTTSILPFAVGKLTRNADAVPTTNITRNTGQYTSNGRTHAIAKPARVKDKKVAPLNCKFHVDVRADGTVTTKALVPPELAGAGIKAHLSEASRDVVISHP
jgi:hypothetical protein